jgi:hypothetical protein
MFAPEGKNAFTPASQQCTNGCLLIQGDGIVERIYPRVDHASNTYYERVSNVARLRWLSILNG